MKTSIPRLSSVKLRDGGAKLHVLRNTKAEDCRRAFARDQAHVADKRGANMAGYAIVAWGVDGGVSTAVGIADSHQVGMMMVPEFVKTAIIDYIASRD